MPTHSNSELDKLLHRTISDTGFTLSGNTVTLTGTLTAQQIHELDVGAAQQKYFLALVAGVLKLMIR